MSALPQVWAFCFLPEFPTSFSRVKGIHPTIMLEEAASFVKGEFLLLSA